MRAPGTGRGDEELIIAPGSPPVRATGTGRGDEGMAIFTSIPFPTSISFSIGAALIYAALGYVVSGRLFLFRGWLLCPVCCLSMHVEGCANEYGRYYEAPRWPSGRGSVINPLYFPCLIDRVGREV